jgi:hypothetical protein
MRRRHLVMAAAGALALAVVFGLWWARGGQGWIAVHTGTDNEPGPFYGFWSGFGSDLGEYALVVGLAGNVTLLWRKHTCHYAWWCWRHPHHQLEGTPFLLCEHHHPDDHPSVREAVAAAAGP